MAFVVSPEISQLNCFSMGMVTLLPRLPPRQCSPSPFGRMFLSVLQCKYLCLSLSVWREPFLLSFFRWPPPMKLPVQLQVSLQHYPSWAMLLVPLSTFCISAAIYCSYIEYCGIDPSTCCFLKIMWTLRSPNVATWLYTASKQLTILQIKLCSSAGK